MAATSVSAELEDNLQHLLLLMVSAAQMCGQPGLSQQVCMADGTWSAVHSTSPVMCVSPSHLLCCCPAGGFQGLPALAVRPAVLHAGGTDPCSRDLQEPHAAAQQWACSGQVMAGRWQTLAACISGSCLPAPLGVQKPIHAWLHCSMCGACATCAQPGSATAGPVLGIGSVVSRPLQPAAQRHVHRNFSSNRVGDAQCAATGQCTSAAPAFKASGQQQARQQCATSHARGVECHWQPHQPR